MKKNIAIALSGGVDSLVSAYLLKQKGHHVMGFHFLTGFEPPLPGASYGMDINSRIAELKRRFQPLEDQLHISIDIIDVSREFKEKVVDYFIHTYRNGQTPNPCLVCNPAIKFTALFNTVKQSGANTLATGHYVKKEVDQKGGCHLYRGIDPVKDQSYFLAFLNQSQLAAACFPLGDMKKTDVIQVARKERLSPIFSSESQDICFIRDKTYGDFLSQQEDHTPEPGPICHVNGNILGEHKGLHLFTIGQRRGINCPGPKPYYVVRIEPKTNRLVVGAKEDLLLSQCRVSGINWIQPPPDPEMNLYTQVRYRHSAARSNVRSLNGHHAEVTFRRKQSAITPGQGAVFYHHNEVLGGGFIEG